MRRSEYLQMRGDLERKKPRWERDDYLVKQARLLKDYFAQMDKDDREFDLELQGEAEEKEQNAWRLLPDYTELYCDLRQEITSDEAEQISHELSNDSNMGNMLDALIRELWEVEEKAQQITENAIDKAEAEWVSGGWDQDGWRAKIWRTLPGYQELYYELYCSMPIETLSALINDYLFGCREIDCNMVYMLEALESDLSARAEKDCACAG